MKFTHLHVHSHYSLLDGLPKIDELLDYVKELGMDAVALTDHGVLYGAVEFYKKAKERGIKPLIGSEVYLALESMDQKRPNIDDKRYHMGLLVKNEEGYRNLVKLITKAHLEGYYYKPRIDEALLEQHAAGLIGLSGCLQGKLPKLILAHKWEEAEKLARHYQEIFGKDGFYFELQDHPHIPEQQQVNEALIGLSKKLKIPLVATNDSHYLKKEDAEAQDILMMINTGANPNDPERLTMKAGDFSLRGPEEMKRRFKDVPEAIENTQKVAALCNFDFTLGQAKLPSFAVPNNKEPDEYLKELCYQGLKKRGKKETKEVQERLTKELAVIKETGFAPYFLIVHDFVNWAKKNRIVVGPGRGSIGGSLVAYLLNITDIDPLKYDLLFERFLNRERKAGLPDIDLDFTDRRRDEVITYVREKYGKDKVAQIITFGTMAARAVIRDVGRALQYPYLYCDRIAKMIPFAFTLEETLKRIPEFKELYETDEKARRLIEAARKLEGVARHASTHACGVVIAKEPLDEIVPLQHPTQSDENIVTQYEMYSIEDLGLLKMDFLGLKNLTIIEDTLARIYKIHGQSIDIATLPLDDQKTYRLLQRGETKGVFQMESDGLRRYLKLLKPTAFEDIVAMVALYRPGPMQFIPDYIARKHGKRKITYLHPKLKAILEKTYGVCIFQEDLMKIAQELAGFTMAEADFLRKAVGKKIKSLLLEQKEKMIKGMVDNDLDKKIAQEIWEWVLPFARYGFNKCLTGDTEILTPAGSIRTIKELYNESKLKKPFPNKGTARSARCNSFGIKDRSTISLNKNLKLRTGRIAEIVNNGMRPVYEIKVLSGRKIKATPEHRFFLFDGWKRLKELKEGDRIALARYWPINKMHKAKWPWHKVALLGYVLSEGNTCHPHSFYLYSNSEEEVEEFKRVLEKFRNTRATISERKRKGRGRYSVYAGRENLKETSEAVKWIMNDLNLKYKKATQKSIPPSALRLNNEQTATLLGIMWNGEGWVASERQQIYYATSSEKLAHQVQDLLLRFGIVAKFHKKYFNYRGGKRVGWTVSLSRYDNLLKFAQHLGPHLIGKKKRDLERLLSSHPILENENLVLSKPASFSSFFDRGSSKLFARGTLETIPMGIRNEIRRECQALNVPMKTAARWAEVSERLFWLDPHKEGFQSETVKKISERLASEKLANWAESDIFWDKIISIKYIGKQQTYDLTIEKVHNFVANGFIVHNSHSVAYGMIAYQTAWLKANWPIEFMAALLTSERNDVERIALLIDECQKMGLEVLAPDINESFRTFSVVPKENKIRFGLWAIKNVGTNVVEAIIKERKRGGAFESIQDFVLRVNSKDLNKKSLESLIKAGCFDKLAERNLLLRNLEKLLAWSREGQRNQQQGQGMLFGTEVNFTSNLSLPEAPPASKKEKLKWEKELLGLYISEHPLEEFKNILRQKTIPLAKITQELTGRLVKIGGIIAGIKKIITRNGKPMLFVNLEDQTDKIEVIAFPNILEKNGTLFQEDKVVFIEGRVDDRDGTPKVICQSIEEIVEK